MTGHDSTTAGPERPDRVTQLLTDNLDRLRQARPEFRAELEARLMARLPEQHRPWWRGLSAAPFQRAREGTPVAARRWPLVGLATAAAVAVALVGAAFLAGRPSEVSAAELLQRAELSAANPFAAGLKSFHLQARSAGTLPHGEQVPDGVLEQWFSAPDRTRTETRSTAPDGSTIIAGSASDGKTMRSYATPGHEGRTVSVMPMAIFVSIDRDGPPPPAAEKAVKGVRVEEDRVFERALCVRGERKGETTVAGRAAYVLEHQVCPSSNVPEELRNRRHVLAIDRESYLPLRLEEYDRQGKLQFKYEVTALRYDVKISDAVFSEVPPAGTVLKHEGPVPRLAIPEQEGRRATRP